MINPHASAQHNLVHSLRANLGLFTDLEIICGDTVHKVHRCIVCSQSRRFEKKCKKRELEGWEAVIEVYRRPENQLGIDCGHDPATLGRMLDYMYGKKTEHLSHVEVLDCIIMADYYDVWPMVDEYVTEFVQMSTDALLSDSLFSYVLNMVYNEAPEIERLRTYICRFAAENKITFLGTTVGVMVLQQHPDIALDVLSLVHETWRPWKQGPIVDEGRPAYADGVWLLSADEIRSEI